MALDVWPAGTYEHAPPSHH